MNYQSKAGVNMEEKEIKIFQEPVFDSASIPVEVASKAMGIDKQTLRVMLQNNMFEWGKAIKMPNSSQYTYWISPRLFWLATGYIYQKGGAL